MQTMPQTKKLKGTGTEVQESGPSLASLIPDLAVRYTATGTPYNDSVPIKVVFEGTCKASDLDALQGALDRLTQGEGKS